MSIIRNINTWCIQNAEQVMYIVTTGLQNVKWPRNGSREAI